MSTQSEEGSADVKQRPPQPKRLARCCRGCTWKTRPPATGRRVTGSARDNIPSTALPVSMRRLRNTPRPAARTTTKAKQRA